MEEIEVNGKKYVLKEDIEKEDVRKENKLTMINGVMEASNVSALGAVTLKGEWVKTRVAVNYLGKAVGSFEKMGIESVDIVFTKDMPVILGRIDNDIASGIIIAPRIEN